MQELPLVSIIINTHNDTEYLEQAISSALSQTYKNIEVILYDNASDVDIKKYIKKYIGEIKYYRSETFLTLGAARNAAIQKSKGEFITFLDADDIYIDEKLEKQIPLFDKSSIGLVYSNTFHLIRSGNIWSDEKLHDRPMPEGQIFCDLLKRNLIPFNTAVFRRSCLHENTKYWFNESFDFCTDYELFLRISHDNDIAYVEEVLGKWRIHGENYTFKKPYLISAERYLMIPRILEYEPELFNKYKKEMNIFLSEIYIDMGRYFMSLGNKRDGLIAFFTAILSSFTKKSVSLFAHGFKSLFTLEKQG